MKLNNKPADVLTSGDFEEIGFSMDLTNQAIIFDILRSKIYKNNIGAICREIACNSRDAQREILCFDKPIEIEIKDETNSIFYEDGLNIIFRDFGIGLSPERVKSIYTKYGASTNRNSDVATGGFGMGSKTPFSYSDSFIVRTIYNNIEYVYSIYIDASKEGKMALLSETEMIRDGNMTEIIIPLNNKDRWSFEYEIFKNTYFWEVRPKLIGFNSEYPESNYVKILDKDIHFPDKYSIFDYCDIFHNNINVVIDGILYPIDMDILGIKFNSFNSNAVLYYNNGELDISANRETLQYSKETIERLKNDIENFRKEISLFYNDEISSCKTLFELFVLYNDLKHKNIFNFIKDKIDKKLFTKEIDENGLVQSWDWNKRIDLNKLEFIHYYKSHFGLVKDNFTELNINISKFKSADCIYIMDMDDADKNKRLSSGINRALFTKHPNGFIIIKHNRKYDYFSNVYNDKTIIKDELNQLSLIGLNISQNYWDVTPEKIKRAPSTKKKDKTIVTLKIVNLGNNSNFYYKDFYYINNELKTVDGLEENLLYHFVDDIKIKDDMVYYSLNEAKLILNNITNKKWKIVIVNSKKLKYLHQFKSVEDELNLHFDKIRLLYIRNKFKNDIEKFISFQNKICIDEYKNVHKELELACKNENLEFYNFKHLYSPIIYGFDIKLIKEYFEVIFKKYPLLSLDFERKNFMLKTKIPEYIDSINELFILRKTKLTQTQK